MAGAATLDGGREPQAPHPFRPLSTLLETWKRETEEQAQLWPGPGLVREGLDLFGELSVTPSEPVLLGTDVHAGNVLRAQREPWLVIDPKPFVGDRTYDATPHLDLTRAVIVQAVVRRERRAAAVVVIGHEDCVRVPAEDLDDVDLRVVAEAPVGREHPEGGEEPRRRREFHARLDVAVGERKEVRRSVVGAHQHREAGTRSEFAFLVTFLRGSASPC
jgi:hypothetical protein